MTSGPVVPRGEGAVVRLRVSPGNTGRRSLFEDAPPELRVATPPTGAAALDARVVRGPSARNETVLSDGVGAGRVREVLASRPR